MKEESDTGSSEVLERIASRHLLSPHNHLLVSSKQDSPPLASSSPSPASVSSITSISKVSSSTNGNGTSNVSSLSGPIKRPKSSFDAVDLVRAQLYGNALVTIGNDLAAAAAAASGLSFPAISAEQSRLLMQELANVAARTALSSTNSTRSKSSSSDGSNAGSPLSSLSLSVNTKSGVKPRSADSPGSGSIASTTSSREKVFVCQICNRSFGYKHVLQNHERTHTGEKPFECRECHKRFTRDHHLKTHMRLHTGEKPYHCTHCDRQFVQVANLRRHLRVHTGERPYACELCTSRFSDSNQLKAHMLIHKGEKPFECKKCTGRFRRRHHLMHHKCPKDEANLGKPRRGRRPKAYDQLQTASPNSLSSSRPGSADELLAHLPLLAATAAVSSTTVNPLTSNFYHHASKPPASHHLPHLRPPPLHHPLSSPTSMPPTAHHFTDRDSPPKSRRKPRHTIRILSQPQHSDLFDDLDGHDDNDNVQTQPLNLSISPGLNVTTHINLNSRRAYNSSNGAPDEDVLDLSRSRSDAESEPEPIEEDEDEDDGIVKDELDDDIDDAVMLSVSDDDIENGQDGFKHRHLHFSKHYSSNHISNNNNHRSNNSLFTAKLQNLDTKSLIDKGNGISSIELAAFGVAQLDNHKTSTASSNGVPLIKANSEKAEKVTTESNENNSVLPSLVDQ